MHLSVCGNNYFFSYVITSPSLQTDVSGDSSGNTDVIVSIIGIISSVAFVGMTFAIIGLIMVKRNLSQPSSKTCSSAPVETVSTSEYIDIGNDLHSIQ